MRYRTSDSTYRCSATDVADFLRCDHLTQLRRRDAIARAEGRLEPDAGSDLARRKGLEFEASVIAELRAVRGDDAVVDCQPREGMPWTESVAIRDEALAARAPYITQAPLTSGELAGYADLLELTGDGWYRPVEIKFARSVRPAFVLQLMMYAEALAELTGELPREVQVITGDRVRTPFDTVKFIAYYRTVKSRFEAAMALDLDAQLAQVPDPVAHCERCDYAGECDTARDAADHLARVARMRVDQVRKLRLDGIFHLSELATTDRERVSGIGQETFTTLKRQAELQLVERETGALRYELREPDGTGRGFALLPEPDAGDIFFDFEGYPYHESGGLEYLWGWVTSEPDGETPFRYFWADTEREEERAFGDFLAYVHERRRTHPGLHIYHYAPYEVTMLRRLADKHPHHAEALDVLLREHVFCDLYTVVRHALLVSKPSYSIKYLEPFYGVSRRGDEVATAGASITEYERWLDTEDAAIRQAILDYNEVDCVSTVKLRDWLLERKAEGEAAGLVWEARSGEAPEERDEPERVRLVRRLETIAAGVTPLPRLAELGEAEVERAREVCGLLAGLVDYQRRIRRREWGELFARAGTVDADDFIDDPEGLGGAVEVRREPAPGRKTGVFVTFELPDQPNQAGLGDWLVDPVTAVQYGKAEDLRELPGGALELVMHWTPKQQERWQQLGAPAFSGAFITRNELPTESLVAAVEQLAESVVRDIDHGRAVVVDGHVEEGARRILAGALPRMCSRSEGETLVDEGVEATPAELAALFTDICAGAVIVQGPPGTGKTWSTARAVADLLQRGLKVGVASNGRKAVCNVLEAIHEYLIDEGIPHGPGTNIRGVYACKEGQERPERCGDWLTVVEVEKSLTAAGADAFLAGEGALLAGTAWQFATEALEGKLDVLVVDEAGQYSLFNLTAGAMCAPRVVLVGDPQQLPQPSSVTHPGGAGASAIGHFLSEEQQVVPGERGVLLRTTYRMHPEICEWVSDSFYAGELAAHPDTAAQRVRCAGSDELSGAGLRAIAVEHAGNSTESVEEVARIAELVEQLTSEGSTWTDPDGVEHPLTLDDIVIVAPYNRQRRLLREALPNGARIGTVDKFQGQEAPVAIWSVTSSDRDTVPRGFEFLLSPNRMNVAVSRARCLAIVVHSPALLATRAHNVEEMQLVNNLCLFVERAGRSRQSMLAE